MCSSPFGPGGRERARRFLATAVMAGMALAALPLQAAAPSDARPDVTVREQGGVYFVVARFQVPDTPEAVLAVLTDYERIPRFMPGIRRSVVREQAGGRAIVEQQAVTRLMLFSKRVHLTLAVTESSDRLHFDDISGASFERYEGSWRLVECDGATRVVYELVADPSFEVPRFVLMRLLNRDSRHMVAALQQEVAARSAAARQTQRGGFVSATSTAR